MIGLSCDSFGHLRVTGYDGERHREAEVGRPITTFSKLPDTDLKRDKLRRAPWSVLHPETKARTNILSMTRIRTKKKKRDAGQRSASATNLRRGNPVAILMPLHNEDMPLIKHGTLASGLKVIDMTSSQPGATEAYEVKFYDVSTFKKPFLIGTARATADAVDTDALIAAPLPQTDWVGDLGYPMVEVTDEYRDKCLDGKIPPWDPGAKELMQEMIRRLRRQREEGDASLR